MTYGYEQALEIWAMEVWSIFWSWVFWVCAGVVAAFLLAHGWSSLFRKHFPDDER